MSNVPSNLIPTRITQLPMAPVASEDGLLLFIYQGNSYQIRAGDLLSVAGVPTTRQVSAGTGLTGGGPLATDITLSVAVGGIGSAQLAASGVTPGTYGSSATVPVFTVDATGRVMSITNVAVAVSGYVPESRQVIAGAGLTGGGALNANVTLVANLSNSTPTSGYQTGASGVATAMSRSDHRHPAVDLANDNEVDGLLGLSNGGTAKSIVPDAGAIIWCGADGLYVSVTGSAGQVLVSGGASAPSWGSAMIISDQPANVVYAGPASGPAGLTTFRALVTADLPSGTGTVTSVAALTLGTTGTDLSSTVANGSTTPVITLQVPTASATNRGALSSADWSTFNNKQPAGAYLAAVDADAPLTGYGTSASHLSIPAATSLVNGYLTSTDWSTFNGKQPSGAYLTAVTADSPIVGSGTSASHLSMPAASGSVSGYLSSTDWSTFNGKQDVFGSQTANYVYAAPNGSAGSPTFRALVAADIPSLSGSYVPYTGASTDVDLNAKHLVNVAHFGVGTAVAPDIPVRVVANNDSLSRIAIRGYSSDANSSSMRVSKFRGTVGAPQVPQSADSLGKFEIAGYATTSADALPGASLEGVATETWGATAHGTKLLVKVTPNTTTTQATAITIDQDKSVSLAGALSVTGHTTFEGITSTGATGTGKLVYDTSPTLVTPSLGVASATSLAITGTAGAGFQTFVGQSSNPTSPAAGTLLVHSKTVNGFTRLEQDNESATNVVYARDNVFIAENPTGSTIPKGSTVYVSGTVSGAPQVQLARANSSSTLPCVGITTDAILAGGFGQVMYAGLLTFDTTAFSTGNQVWVSTSTAGALTATRPSGTTNSAQRMGTILVSGNSTTGLMLVQTSPALLNMETGTNAATWTGSTVVALTGISGGVF